MVGPRRGELDGWLPSSEDELEPSDCCRELRCLPPEKYEPRPIVHPPPPPLSPPRDDGPSSSSDAEFVRLSEPDPLDEPSDVARRGVLPRSSEYESRGRCAPRCGRAGAVSAITSPRPRAASRGGGGGGGAPAGQSGSGGGGVGADGCGGGVGVTLAFGGHATAAAPPLAPPPASTSSSSASSSAANAERCGCRGEVRPDVSEITQPKSRNCTTAIGDENQPELPASSESRRRASRGGKLSGGSSSSPMSSAIAPSCVALEPGIARCVAPSSATTRAARGEVARCTRACAAPMAASSSFTACATSGAFSHIHHDRRYRVEHGTTVAASPTFTAIGALIEGIAQLDDTRSTRCTSSSSA